MPMSSPHGLDAGASPTLVVPVATSAPSPAGRMMGNFTLPVAAAWGGRVLPPGRYNFFIPAAPPAWVLVQGRARLEASSAASGSTTPGRPASLLTLHYDRDGYRVRSLRLPEAGKLLLFAAPIPSTREGARGRIRPGPVRPGTTAPTPERRPRIGRVACSRT